MKKIAEIFEECRPFSLEEFYFVENPDAEFELVFSKDKKPKRIFITPKNPEYPKVPERLYNLAKLLWDLNKW